MIGTSIFHLFFSYFVASQGSNTHITITLVILYIYPTFLLHLCSLISIQPIETIHTNVGYIPPRSGFVCLHSSLFSIFVCILKQIGIFILILTQYLPLYIYGNPSNLGNVTHSIFVSPLHFIKCLYFYVSQELYIFSDSQFLQMHTLLLFYINCTQYSVAFSVAFYTVVYYGLFASLYSNFTAIIHLIFAIYFTTVTFIILHQLFHIQ